MKPHGEPAKAFARAHARALVTSRDGLRRASLEELLEACGAVGVAQSYVDKALGWCGKAGGHRRARAYLAQCVENAAERIEGAVMVRAEGRATEAERVRWGAGVLEPMVEKLADGMDLPRPRSRAELAVEQQRQRVALARVVIAERGEG